MREQHGLELPSDVQTTYVRDVALLREQLGEAAFREAWSEGRAMSFEQAVEYALAITALAETALGGDLGPATTAGTPGPSLDGDPEVARLTPREREVAVLVTRGLTNRQMAEALVLSERTVDSHVRNIMGKLEVSSRARIAAWAVEHGLGGAR